MWRYVIALQNEKKTKTVVRYITGERLCGIIYDYNLNSIIPIFTKNLFCYCVILDEKLAWNKHVEKYTITASLIVNVNET